MFRNQLVAEDDSTSRSFQDSYSIVKVKRLLCKVEQLLFFLMIREQRGGGGLTEYLKLSCIGQRGKKRWAVLILNLGK